MANIIATRSHWKSALKQLLAEIVLPVKFYVEFDISNSFKLWIVQDYVRVTMRYVGITHLNQGHVNFDLTLSCSEQYRQIIVCSVAHYNHKDLFWYEYVRYKHQGCAK